MEVRADYSLVGSGSVSYAGANGNSGAQSLAIGIAHRIIEIPGAFLCPVMIAEEDKEHAPDRGTRSNRLPSV